MHKFQKSTGRWWIHPDLETHGQSHPKSETQGTSGSIKLTLDQQKRFYMKRAFLILSDDPHVGFKGGSCIHDTLLFEGHLNAGIVAYKSEKLWALILLQHFVCWSDRIKSAMFYFQGLVQGLVYLHVKLSMDRSIAR